MGYSQHMDDEILKSLCRHTVDGLQQVYFQRASLCSPRQSEDSKELPNLLSLHALLSDYVARADPPLYGISNLSLGTRVYISPRRVLRKIIYFETNGFGHYDRFYFPQAGATCGRDHCHV